MSEADRISYSIYSKEYISKKIKKRFISEDTILSYEGEEFLEACYKWLFQREIDESGRRTYLNLMNDGMARQGIIYLLANTEEFADRFPLKNEDIYRKFYLQYEWDVSYLLDYEDFVEFIFKCYDVILERQPDEKGILSYLYFLLQGGPKEAVIGMLAASEEGKNRKRIKNSDDYCQVWQKWEKKRKKFITRILLRIKRFLNYRRRMERELQICCSELLLLRVQLQRRESQ